MKCQSNSLNMVTMYYNPNDLSEIFNRYFLFKNMIEASGINLVTVECEKFSSQGNKWPINSNVKYHFTEFNYFEALIKGIENLPDNWSKVLFADINVEFLDSDFANKIEKSFNQNEIIQLFEKCVVVNPLSEEIVDTNFSLAYSQSIPIDKNYFSLWFADPGCGWGITRAVFEEIKSELLNINGQILSSSIFAFCAVNKVEKVFRESENFLSLQRTMQRFSCGYASNTIFKYVKSNICQYEEFLKDLSNFESKAESAFESYEHKICGIYPELKCKFDMLDFVLDLNETLAQGKLLKNIWGNISSMTIESVTSHVVNNSKISKKAKNEKIMTIELNMNIEDNSTIVSDDNDSMSNSDIGNDAYLDEDELDTDIIFSGSDQEKLMYQYGACQMKCKMTSNDSDDNIRRNQNIGVVENINYEQNNNYNERQDFNNNYKKNGSFHNNHENNSFRGNNEVYHTKVVVEVKIEEDHRQQNPQVIESRQENNNYNYSNNYNYNINYNSNYNNKNNDNNAPVIENNQESYNNDDDNNNDYNPPVVIDNNEEVYKNDEYNSNRYGNDPPVIIENKQETYQNYDRNYADYNNTPIIIENKQDLEESYKDTLFEVASNNNQNANQNYGFSMAQQNVMSLDDDYSNNNNYNNNNGYSGAMQVAITLDDNNYDNNNNQGYAGAQQAAISLDDNNYGNDNNNQGFAGAQQGAMSLDF